MINKSGYTTGKSIWLALYGKLRSRVIIEKQTVKVDAMSALSVVVNAQADAHRKASEDKVPVSEPEFSTGHHNNKSG